ncbi:MAG: hypothetical protein F6K11_23090 [Leptolyngbya sp. SIO3F4]|nr:hypothetical protein [Leptolyngbya sp. SIO3F4]
MKERAKRAQQYIVVVVCFPLFFLIQRGVIIAFLSGLTWDESIYIFLDGVLNLPPPGASKVITDVLAVPSTVWHVWFLLAAVEEVRLTRSIDPVFFVEIVTRWLSLGFASQLLPSLTAIFFYFLLIKLIWSPLAVTLSIFLGVLLYVFGWKYPAKRLKHVERIYYFEQVRER